MSPPITRREFLRASTGAMILAVAPIATATILPTMRVASGAQPLTLTTIGDARSLPPKILGASTEARRYDPTERGAKPVRVEMLVAADLGNTAHIPAQVTPLDPNAPLVLPSLSIARVIWE